MSPLKYILTTILLLPLFYIHCESDTALNADGSERHVLHIDSDGAVEELFLHRLHGNQLAVEHSFEIETDRKEQGDFYDVFPKNIGKILQHLPVESFSVSLTRGRWDVDEWGPNTITAHPVGLFLRARIFTVDAANTWEHLLSILDGLLMIDSSRIADWRTQISDLGEKDGFTTYISTSQEDGPCVQHIVNLSEFFPCRYQGGFITLFSPFKILKSPYVSLSLHAERNSTGKMKLRTILNFVGQLDTEILEQTDHLTLLALFQSSTFTPCHLMDRSALLIKNPVFTPPTNEIPAGAKICSFYSSNAERQISEDIYSFDPVSLQKIRCTWHEILGIDNIGPVFALPPRVQRQEIGSLKRAVPTRNQSSLLITLRNDNNDFSQDIKYLDAMPYFLKLTAHTVSVSVYREINGRLVQHYEGFGIDALDALKWHWKPTDGLGQNTVFSFEITLSPKSYMTFRCELLKVSLKAAHFTHTVELSLQLPSAVILYRFGERNARQAINGSRWLCEEETGSYWPVCYLENLQPLDKEFVQREYSDSSETQQKHWTLLLTHGLTVNTPDIDPSMAFNAIACTCAIVVMVYGSMVKLTTVF